MDTALVIMSRLPLAGYTKTRLMETLTGDQCAAFHQACLQDICQAALASELTPYLYYHSPPGYADTELSDGGEIWGLEDSLLDNFKIRLQQGSSLGERLERAGQQVLQDHTGVIFIGSDMPEITAEILKEAERILREADVVIGPAADGGYYLLGIKRRWPELFVNIPWGSERVLLTTLEKIKALGLSCRCLAAGADIDTLKDLVEFAARCRANEGNKRRLQSYKAAEQLLQGLI